MPEHYVSGLILPGNSAKLTPGEARCAVLTFSRFQIKEQKDNRDYIYSSSQETMIIIFTSNSMQLS